MSQTGDNDDAGQQIGQLQTSQQDNQVVSGYSSTLSGNNLLCQTMKNSDDISGLCSLDGLIQPPTSPDQNTAPLKITVTTTTIPECGSRVTHCPSYFVSLDILTADLSTIQTIDQNVQ